MATNDENDEQIKSPEVEKKWSAKLFLWFLSVLARMIGHGVLMFARLFRTLLRARLYPKLFQLEQDLFLDESVDPVKARNDAPEFMAKMHELYPAFFKDGLQQMALWFSQNEPPNFLGFKTLDPATGAVLEVMVRKVDGLTPHDINQRMKYGLETIASMPESVIPDVERLRDVAIRTLAVCGARMDVVLMPVEENRDDFNYGELFGFNVLFNLWLDADQKRRRRGEIARNLAAIEKPEPLRGS